MNWCYDLLNWLGEEDDFWGAVVVAVPYLIALFLWHKIEERTGAKDDYEQENKL